MFFFTLLILVLWLFSKYFKEIHWLYNWYKVIISRPYNYLALLALLVIGFFTRLDFTERGGCMSNGEFVWEEKNILFSSVSIALILLSFLVRQRVLSLIFILAELFFWIFKLFWFKGGYAVGFGGTPDMLVSFFDCLTLALRLFIIKSLLIRDVKIKYVLILTYIIIAIKIFIFPIQWYVSNGII